MLSKKKFRSGELSTSYIMPRLLLDVETSDPSFQTDFSLKFSQQ